MDGTDKALLVLGVIGCFFYGIISPAQFIVFGTVTDDFVDFTLWTLNVSQKEVDLEDSMTTVAYWYIGIAVANFVFAWMGLGLFGLVAQRQAFKIRLAMFKNLIYQEIGWFDEHSSGELNVNLSEYVKKFKFISRF
jgi:ABC-type multidrug transport system fused ATPase/permease subunit